jgi:hypothetical protein
MGKTTTPRPEAGSKVAMPHPALVEMLAPAYGPCPHFRCQGGACKDAVWNPAAGHIPRGFLGATGALEDVRLVMVFAEPGHPYADMDFSHATTPEALIAECTAHSHSRRSGANAKGFTGDVFHRNVEWFIEQCFPGASAAEKSRRVWQTEGRLCSVPDEIGKSDSAPCAETYLTRQFALLSHATWVAFGSKAQRTMRRLALPHVAAYALAPPGCNHRPARPTWEAAIHAVLNPRQ